MDDADVLSKVRELVDEEHALRASVGDGAIDLKEEHHPSSSSTPWTNAGTSYASGKPAARQVRISTKQGSAA